MPSIRNPRHSLADRFKRPPHRIARRRACGTRHGGEAAPGFLEIEFEFEEPDDAER